MHIRSALGIFRERVDLLVIGDRVAFHDGLLRERRVNLFLFESSHVCDDVRHDSNVSCVSCHQRIR
jgi:hypothetical protein